MSRCAVTNLLTLSISNTLTIGFDLRRALVTARGAGEIPKEPKRLPEYFHCKLLAAVVHTTYPHRSVRQWGLKVTFDITVLTQ